jgi:signal transduction histidine kinase
MEAPENPRPIESASRARLGLLVGLCLLLFTAVAAGVTIFQLDRTANRVAHSMDIEIALSDLDSSLGAVGRARAIYVELGDDASYAKYQEAAAQVPRQLDYISSLEQGIPAHQESLTQLKELSQHRLSINAQAVEARKAGQPTSLSDTTSQIVAVSNELSALLREMELHEEQFTRQRETTSNRLFLTAQIILACAFVIALSLLYWNYRVLRMELAERREAEKAVRESRDSLRQLSARLMQVQDEERRRFSRELHDSLGQSLVLAKMNLASVAENKMLGGLVDEALKYLDQSIAETRTISYLLHPPLLDDVGFASAAEWLVQGFAERSGINAKVYIPERTARLAHGIELALFRVLQECLTNIHRHSAAQRADVWYEISDGDAVLKVHDYGKGMGDGVLANVQNGIRPSGVGLAGMRERVREQGGHIEIFSDANGTEVVVSIPVADGEAQRNAKPPLSTLS